MKTKNLRIALVSLMFSIATTFAQNTAFTYQGRLIDNGARANSNYDLRFTIYDAVTDGTQISATLTNSSVVVSNGLFTTQLDFGANVFTNSSLWLEVGERLSGGGDFTTLSPRQQLTAVPYAISAGNLTGSLPASQLSGTLAAAQLPASVITNGASGVSINGAFTGNGAGVTNVGLSSLNSGGAISSVTNWSFTVASTLSVPGGPNWLAVTNFNADNSLDLASVNYDASTVTVLTNDGSGNFISSATYSVGLHPETVITTDVNGDGKPDLISANNGTNTLTVLTNDGEGGFSLSGTYAVGANPVQVITLDVNGDGKPDLISADSGTNTLTILTNDGSGVFSLYAKYVVGSGPQGVTVSDVNGDGKPDLISANFGDDTLTVLTNNGSGGFGSNATYSVGSGPQFVVPDDVNGDGKLDLTVVNYKGNSITVLTNNGSGGFESNATYPVGFNSYALAVIDVNHDGWPDLVIPNNEGDTLLVMTNDGAGNFVSNNTYTVGASPDYVATLDVNGDGFPDLITANYGDGTLTVLTNTEEIVGEFAGTFSGTFSGSGAGLTNLNASQISGSIPASQISDTMTAAQLPDISQLNGTLSTAQLPSTVVMNNESGVSLTGSFNGSFSGDASDLENLNAGALSGVVGADHLPDLSGMNGILSLAQLPTTVITNGASGVNITGTFTGDGAGVTNVSFSSIGNNPFTLNLETLGTNFPTAYTVGKKPSMIIAADVNGDSNVDLISANFGDNTLTVLTNNGSGVFGSSAVYAVGGNPSCVVAADVNGDSNVDLISANSGDNTLTVLTNNGFGIFGSNATINVGTYAPFVAAADVNGDGKVDLITANHSADSATVFTNDGFGNFSSNATYSVGGSEPPMVVTADVNGDGKPDLIFGNFDSDNTATVLTNDGSGHFAFCSSYGSGGDITDITTADMNGDGKPDLIFTDTSGQITVATNDGSGHFTDTLPDEGENASGYYSFAYIDFVTTADANGDGKLDLVFIANDDNGFFYLGIATNDGSGNFTLAFSQEIGDYNADPNWIAPADFNGDDRMDFAVSDYNSNSVTVFAGGDNSVSVLPPAPQVQQAQEVIGSDIMALTNSQNNFTGTFTGDGGGLTNLNAAQISSGTMTAAQLPDISQLNGTLSTAQLPSAVVTNNEIGVSLTGSFNGSFSGDASQLANLNAGALSGMVGADHLPDLSGMNGILSLAQLPTTVITNNEDGVALGGVNVNGNGKISGGLAIDAAATDAGVVSSNTSLLFGGPDSGEGIGSERVTNGPAKQYSLDFYTSSSQRMTVLLNGNVGIGTNTPATLLDVAGSIHAAGTFIGNGSGLTNTVTAGNYLFAYSTQQQSIEDNGVFEAITFGHRPSINGWTYSSSGSFTNAQTGLYLIQYDAVAEESYAVPSAVTLDMAVNGAEIPGSQITTTLTVLNHPFSVSKSFTASLNSGDVAQLRFLGDDASLYLQNGLGNGTNDPSATLTITRLQ